VPARQATTYATPGRFDNPTSPSQGTMNLATGERSDEYYNILAMEQGKERISRCLALFGWGIWGRTQKDDSKKEWASSITIFPLQITIPATAPRIYTGTIFSLRRMFSVEYKQS
jgi:hypothetical protein